MCDLGKLIFIRVSYIYLCLLMGMDRLRFKVAKVVYKSVKKRHLAKGTILYCWIISFDDKGVTLLKIWVNIATTRSRSYPRLGKLYFPIHCVRLITLIVVTCAMTSYRLNLSDNTSTLMVIYNDHQPWFRSSFTFMICHSDQDRT